jgi:hypothetical protein
MRVETLLNHMEHYKGFVYDVCELNRETDTLEVLVRERGGVRVEWRMEGFAVTCPLAPSVPHLVSGSCSSPRAFALELPLRCAPLLQASCSPLPCGLPLPTPPHGDAVALSLPFGFSFTWRGDLHPTRYVPCPAHTFTLTVSATRPRVDEYRPRCGWRFASHLDC